MTLFKDLHAQWMATDPAYRAECERIEAMGWEAFSAEQRELFVQTDNENAPAEQVVKRGVKKR